MKLSNQFISLLGLFLTFIGCLLIGDWQAIPFDPCTEYSPFHYPNNINYTLEPNKTSTEYTLNKTLGMNTTYRFDFDDSLILNLNTGAHVHCELVEQCPTEALSAILLSDDEYRNHYNAFLCLREVVLNKLHNTLIYPTEVCLYLTNEQLLDNKNDPSSIQTVAVLPKSLYYVARNNCEHAVITNEHCHWLPFSFLTQQDCNDCPAICRSKKRTLYFEQFAIGAAILMLCGPMSWVTIAAIISYQTPKQLQVYR